MTHVVHQSTLQCTRAALCGLLLLVALTPFSFAQSQTQPAPVPNLYLVRETHVKLEMIRDYQALMQNEGLPGLKKGGVKQRNALTPTAFGAAGTYIFVEPVDSLKRFDEQDTLRKALGQEGYRAWLAKWGQAVSASRAYIVQLRPDLSANLPKSGTPPAKYAMGVKVTVAPGRTAEYESYVKNDLLPTLQKAYPKGVMVSKVLLGGDGNEYRALMLVDSFDELEKGLLAAVRDGFLKLQAKTAGIVLHIENSVLRYVPELSIQPEAPKAAQ